MQDDKVARVKEIGRNLVEIRGHHGIMIMDPENDKLDYLRDTKRLHVLTVMVTTSISTQILMKLSASFADLKGELVMEDGALRLKFDQLRFIMLTIFYLEEALHGQDVFENEGRLMNLFRMRLSKRGRHIIHQFEPTPSPSK